MLERIIYLRVVFLPLLGVIFLPDIATNSCFSFFYCWTGAVGAIGTSDWLILVVAVPFTLLYSSARGCQ